LKERRAVRFTVGYAVAAWIAAQVIGFFVEQEYVGRTVLDVTLWLLAVGFLATLVLVWFHGQEGQQRVHRVEAVLLGALGVMALGGSVVVATRGPADLQIDSRDIFIDLGDRSIAVLPFENELTDPALAFLDRGVSELLATDLAQVEDLSVVGGQRLIDLMRQLGDQDSRVIPQELRTAVTKLAGARYMLTGSILGTSDNVIIVASLEDTFTGKIEAATRQQGSDVFAVVDAVSADLLENALAPGSTGALAPVADLTTRDLDAFAHYERGREAQRRFLFEEAQEHFEAALAIDSAFARAWVSLSGVQAQAGDFSASMESLASARANLGNASEYDRLFVEGRTAFIRGDIDGGAAALEELIRKYPQEKEARLQLYSFYNQTGRTDEALIVMEGALRLDPSYAAGYNELAYAIARRGNIDSALVLLSTYAALEPDQPNPHDSRGEILEMAGRYEEARAAYRRALEVFPGFSLAIRHMARAYMREDLAARGLREMEIYLESEYADGRAVTNMMLGDLHLWLGEIDAGLERYGAAADAAGTDGAPSQHRNALRSLAFNAVLVGRPDVGLRAADELVELDRMEAAAAYFARILVAGERGDRPGVTALLDRIEREFRNYEAFAPFMPMMMNSTAATDAFYRGEYERVLELAAAAPFARPNGDHEFFGLLVMRSMVELGLGDRVLDQGGVAREAGLAGLPGQFDPVLERLLTYYEGRGHELVGDTTKAVASYRTLLEGWGDAVGEVPWVADTADRLAALGQ